MLLLRLVDQDETRQLVGGRLLVLAYLDVALSSLLIKLWLVGEHIVVIT